MKNTPTSLWRQENYAVIRLIENHQCIAQKEFAADGTEKRVSLSGTEWSVQGSWSDEPDNGRHPLRMKACYRSGGTVYCSIGLRMCLTGLHGDEYLLLPAGVYDGNGFAVRKVPYPPDFPMDRKNICFPPTVTDIPRLDTGKENATLTLLCRDLSYPCIGLFSPQAGMAWFCEIPQAIERPDAGITVERSLCGERLHIGVYFPGVRENTRYTIASMDAASPDEGVEVSPGFTGEAAVSIEEAACEDLADFLAYYASIWHRAYRQSLKGRALENRLPLSAAYRLHEEKYNRRNWSETLEYYRVGCNEQAIYEGWQTGWVGGGMASYALYCEGTALSRRRALQTMGYAFERMQAPSGLFYSGSHNGRIWGDCFGDPWNSTAHLLRRSADFLYFFFKLKRVMEKRKEECPEKWMEGAFRCAEAFLRLWDEQQGFGQFADARTGELWIGGSSSCGIVCAALALADRYEKSGKYRRLAERAMKFYDEKYLSQGLSNGGPGEILSAPDSESAFGLLESAVVLYEETGEPQWLETARRAAHLCLTWCVPYRFRFPPQSLFGKRDMDTRGAVYANVQNKHGAPGICTLSGDSLLRLYRYTGDVLYLDMLTSIAHNITQYVSRPDCRLYSFDGIPLEDGWMNERVEMSDWFEPVGEIFYGSCWCEVSCMLTYCEIPGLLLDAEAGWMHCIDHIEAKILYAGSKTMDVEIRNPTGYDAQVLIEAGVAGRGLYPVSAGESRVIRADAARGKLAFL